MPGFEKFVINETGHFVPSQFPQLDTSLRQAMEVLANEPADSKAQMIYILC